MAEVDYTVARVEDVDLRDVAERTGASRAELTYRTQFAERFPTEDELLTAVNSYRSSEHEREAMAHIDCVAAIQAQRLNGPDIG